MSATAAGTYIGELVLESAGADCSVTPRLELTG